MNINSAVHPALRQCFSAPLGAFEPLSARALVFRVLGVCAASPLQKSKGPVACFCQWNHFKSFVPEVGVDAYRLGSSPELEEPLLRVSLYLGLSENRTFPSIGAFEASWKPAVQSPCILVCPSVPGPVEAIDRGPRGRGDGASPADLSPDLLGYRCRSAPFRVFHYMARVTVEWTNVGTGTLSVQAAGPESCSGADIDQMREQLQGALLGSSNDCSGETCGEPHPLRSGDPSLPWLDVGSFADSVERLQEDMRKGLCYLANLTVTQSIPEDILSASAEGFLWRWFGSQRDQIRPPRFGWFLQSEAFHLESFSPERFIRRAGDVILTEPIKGTARVAESPAGIMCSADGGGINSCSAAAEQDAVQALWSSQKERAEQHLVTDLLRNDLSLVCRPGSVQVCKPFEVRIDSGLAQMSTTIWGIVAPHQTLSVLLSRLLPAGSVTGTPKRQVCRTLLELERADRGYYCGLCVDVRSETDFDATLLIRSLFSEVQKGSYAGTGGGITIRSCPELETAEVHDKWRSFMSRCTT